MIVVDEEYQAYASAIKDYGTVFEEQLSEYLRIMEHICENILTQGASASNLKAFATSLLSIDDGAQDLCSALSSADETFLEAIDAADEYLY